MRLLDVCSAAFLAACAAAPREGHWELVATPGDASLRGIAVVDAERLWVTGSGGTVWRTTDGGRSWADVAPPGTGEADFRDVEAFDAETALVMTAGSPGRLHRTSDGGRSWTVVLEDLRDGTFFDGMAFAGREGALVGDPIDGRFCIWVTRDAGLSWAEHDGDAVEALPGEAAFAASGTCVAVAAAPQGPLIWLATGGSDVPRVLCCGPGTQQAAAVPLRAGSASRGAFGLALANTEAGADLVAVGGDFAAPEDEDGTAAWSDDSGASWQAASAGGYRSAAVWLDEQRVLAVGSHGTSLSEDRGRTWRVLGSTGFHCVGRGRDGSVWAAGSDGRVARWRDGR